MGLGGIEVWALERLITAIKILQINNLSAEAKVLLLCLQRDKLLKIKLCDWAKACCMATRTLKVALGELDHIGVIQKDSVPPSGRGRPGNAYRLTSDIGNRLRELLPGEMDVEHGVQVKIFTVLQSFFSLNTSDDEKLTGMRNDDLVPLDRVLLALFLINSDKLGFVCSLSKNQLRKLTGFNADRLNSRINKLLSLKVISVQATGTSSKVVLGRVKSVYFIEFDHLLFCNQALDRAESLSVRGEYRFFQQAVAYLQKERGECVDKKFYKRFVLAERLLNTMPVKTRKLIEVRILLCISWLVEKYGLDFNQGQVERYLDCDKARELMPWLSEPSYGKQTKLYLHELMKPLVVHLIMIMVQEIQGLPESSKKNLFALGRGGVFRISRVYDGPQKAFATPYFQADIFLPST